MCHAGECQPIESFETMTDDNDLENISEINVMKLDFNDIMTNTKLEIEIGHISLDEISKEKVECQPQDPVIETKPWKCSEVDIEELKIQSARKRNGPILNSVTQIISIGTLFKYESPS